MKNFYLKVILMSILVQNLIGLFISCKNPFSTGSTLAFEELEFILPEWTISDFYLAGWIIEIQSESLSQKYRIEENSTTIKILTAKNKPLSITATPVTVVTDKTENSITKETIIFRPAGAIYPYCYKKQIQLTWENGFSAWIMQQLFKSDSNKPDTSRIIHSFNWEKFMEAVNNKIENSLSDFITTDEGIFFNPWLCDYEKILNNLSISSFSNNLLSVKNFKSIVISDYFPQSSSEIYSLFIPENEILKKYKTVTINSTKNNYFASQNNLLIISDSSSKKLSSQVIFLPIYMETYEMQYH